MSGKKKKEKLKTQAPITGAEPVLKEPKIETGKSDEPRVDNDIYIAWVNLSSSKRGVTYRPGDEVPNPEQEWIDFGMVIKKDFH